jgi:hypothetical protein
VNDLSTGDMECGGVPLSVQRLIRIYPNVDSRSNGPDSGLCNDRGSGGDP